jgi:hypothetical protein
MTDETNNNKCERIDEGKGRFICHRCFAFWFESEHRKDWRPMRCPDRVTANDAHNPSIPAKD